MPELTPQIPRESDFTSRLRSPAVAARVGLWLGICFLIAFLTGLYTHVAQAEHPWFPLPTQPSGTYRITQGVHVAAGTAAVPLLLVKLWSVFPKFFARPPWRFRRALMLDALERASIGVLVAAAHFQLASGLATVSQLPVISHALRRGLDDCGLDRSSMADSPGGLSLRGLLQTTFVAAALAVVSTAGSLAADFILTGVRAGRRLQLTPAELAAMPQHAAVLPIACVERWSATGERTGVRIRDLVALLGAPASSAVFVRSLRPRGAYRESRLPANFVADGDTLLAQRLRGEPLSLDHGYPCRIIAPNRPGASVLPRWMRPAVSAAAVILGTVTIMAIPALGRFGARPDNPTLLDRPYLLGWCVLAGLVLTGASAGATIARRRERI